MRIVPLDTDTVDQVVNRVLSSFSEAAQRTTPAGVFINDLLDAAPLREALLSVAPTVWVAVENGRVAGHLHATILDNDVFGRGAWIPPDGVSYESPAVLAALYAHAGQTWVDDGAREHFVWLHDEEHRRDAWLELGFHFMHRRGMMVLTDRPVRPLPPGYTLRRGSRADLATAVRLSQHLSDAQSRGPSFSFALPPDDHDDLGDLLDEIDTRLWLVEHQGDAVAQCITFPLPSRRDTPDHVLHLSAVVVDEDHRGHGIATAMVDAALADGYARDFALIETNWRVPHRLAATFWPRYGFTPTALRLHRSVGQF